MSAAPPFETWAGNLVQAIEQMGQADNTLVIYTSDNGYSWGSHKWKPKQCPYEECMRVPLAIRYAPLAPLPSCPHCGGPLILLSPLPPRGRAP